jgi:hypothetical protein
VVPSEKSSHHSVAAPITEAEESIYESVSSGLQERIDCEIDRLAELSMEVIPLDLI